MPNVYAINKTESSLSVDSWFVYYINNSNAEIVEVEGTQPSFIDVWLYLSGKDSIETKTFAANDYWNSRVIDSTDEQILRDFGVSLVNISGDPIIYGIDSSNSDFSFAPLGLYSGLRTNDLNADMSNFYVANGDGTWSNRKCIWSISAYSTPALTWKCHITKNGGDTSVKYNAFKYTLNGTPYWYVIDGVHDTWTDDLSAWGYREVPVGPVLPTVTFSDDISSGTISALTLPSGHSGYYTGVSFDSLRYYVKGTVSDTGSETRYWYGTSNTWHYGTVTWTDESIGDLSNKIAVNPPTSSGYLEQTVFKIVFITGGIAGYSPRDTSNLNKGQISQYTYNNGVHSITFYTTDSKWYENTDAGRITLRYLNGTISFKYLSAFDLVNVSGGTLSKVTTTDRYDMYNTWNDSVTLNARYASCSEYGVTTVTVCDSSNVFYNAFKYTVNGTYYYYVLDGTQTDWTDDLSGIGYNLIAYTSGSTLESGNTRAMLNSDGTGIVYDTSKTYTVTGLLRSSYESVISESSFVQRSSIIDDGGYAKYKQTYGRLTGMKYVKYTVS